MITIWDDQDGKFVTGTVGTVTDTYFTLVDEWGNYIGKFDIKLLKLLV